MIKTTVGRVYRFRATHSLPDFPEPWCFPHQHDYTIEIATEGDVPTDELDEDWQALGLHLEPDLNRRVQPSSVEQIARYVLNAIPHSVSVTVWEDRQRWGKAER